VVIESVLDAQFLQSCHSHAELTTIRVRLCTTQYTDAIPAQAVACPRNAI
jgi:hypothetical protein